MIYSPHDGAFRTKHGPIFGNLILADEINRAPAKVQSALLEAMQEHQVTIGEETYPLPNPFLVLATQNPLEHEGTYPLPEAQIDRFMMKVVIDYPNRTEERRAFGRCATSRFRGADSKGPACRQRDSYRREDPGLYRRLGARHSPARCRVA